MRIQAKVIAGSCGSKKTGFKRESDWTWDRLLRVEKRKVLKMMLRLSDLVDSNVIAWIENKRDV